MLQESSLAKCNVGKSLHTVPNLIPGYNLRPEQLTEVLLTLHMPDTAPILYLLLQGTVMGSMVFPCFICASSQCKAWRRVSILEAGTTDGFMPWLSWCPRVSVMAWDIEELFTSESEARISREFPTVSGNWWPPISVQWASAGRGWNLAKLKNRSTAFLPSHPKEPRIIAISISTF